MIVRSKVASRTPKCKSKRSNPVANVTNKSAGISLLSIVAGARSGIIRAEIPRTTPTLKRLEPNALPIASYGLFSMAATADEKISGAEVPKATIVRPTNKGETPKFLAKPEAPSTNLSAPQINPRNPTIIISKAISIS